ncbi:hypothetical protein JR316_0005789 [Psilocybe cubensis]|uniref:Uncharacterized protein n=2 Tax=Psilocybe cubensis TaxID=181762 RepID=A0A8H7XZM5_PSICU|nr:hypothetical protein JR316_0005789 [Psilocybe cubensis]KAH9481267.1 hypothetical protein JR316_0005789 [Psilocybe cubensis]
MPTATTTTVAKTALFQAQIPLKATLESSNIPPALSPFKSKTLEASVGTTLRSLYNRAARAFVLRDIPLTHTLLRSAFDLLQSPQSSTDSLSDQRRKWDILRITFESTVYTSPPSASDSLPEALREILSESPQALATSIYTRSLALFTPTAGSAQKTVLNAAYLPTQVLTTLVYCCLKVDAPDVGRVIIEDWLARRDNQADAGGDGYVKVLDLYCLHILPKLGQWDYAKEFLEYEGEMPAQKREHLKATLNNQYMQALAARRTFTPTQDATPSAPLSGSSSPRSYSPAPSSASSSSSSSLSTTSTHTVVPATSRGNRFSPSGLTNISQASSSSISVASDETATPIKQSGPIPLNGTIQSSNPAQRSSRSPSKARTMSSSASSAYSTPHPRAHLAHQVSARPGSPSIYALIRASLAPYLTSTKTTTFILLFVLVPLISFILRMRRQKRLLESGLGALGIGGGGTTAAGIAAAAVSAGSSNAELVRRRLHAAGGGAEGGVVSRAWWEIVRAVGDTVRMAGSGLV